ncbi:hypothetical protein JCM11491_002360 [Sporobolomyces phaffii]
MEDEYAAPVVSFALEDASSTSAGARVGTLTLSTRDAACTVVQTFETPGVISHAPRGAIAHLTPDNARRSLPRTAAAGVHLSLEHFLDVTPPPFSRAPFPLARFIGLSPTPTPTERDRVLISLGLNAPPSPFLPRDAAAPTNGDTAAVAFATRGIVKVSPQTYLDWTLPRPPDLLFALADEPREQHDASGMTRKRAEKSIRRSLAWLDEIAHGAQDRTNVFATLVGGRDEARRTEFARALLGTASSRASAAVDPARPLDPLVAGYVVTCGPAAASAAAELFAASLAPLPRTKPRVAVAPSGPHEILRLVLDVGIDLFVESGVSSPTDTPLSPSSDSRRREIGTNLYLEEHAMAFTPLSTSTLAPRPPSLAPTTRSYVHHLLLAHELTAHVLLALHNHGVMTAFFASIRAVLAAGGIERFRREVERFEARYAAPVPNKSESGPDDGDTDRRQYRVVTEARKSWTVVNAARGKGSQREKALEVEGVEQPV